MGALIAWIALMSPSVLAANAQRGEKLFMANCMACHGVEANGQGPAAAALKPPPRDFTDAAFWEGKTNQDVKKTIKTGRPGTAMMPFPQLSDKDLDDIIAFLRTKKK